MTHNAMQMARVMRILRYRPLCGRRHLFIFSPRLGPRGTTHVAPLPPLSRHTIPFDFRSCCATRPSTGTARCCGRTPVPLAELQTEAAVKKSLVLTVPHITCVLCHEAHLFSRPSGRQRGKRSCAPHFLRRPIDELPLARFGRVADRVAPLNSSDPALPSHTASRRYSLYRKSSAACLKYYQSARS
jgi:hypothetical protein